MAELESLIRVRKHAVEQKQKILSDLYRNAEDLKRQRDELETKLAIEREKAKDLEAEMMGYFVPYAKAVNAEIVVIDTNREKLEHRIKFAQDEVRDAFAEVKKIEIIDERRKADDLKDIDQKESDMLDEIALDAFRRNSDS